MHKSHKKSILDILGRGPIHPFPARMAPGIALEAIGESKTPLRILDPMSGSGTVLAVARAKGHRAFGVDLDPLSVLLASVWTRAVDPVGIVTKANEVLDRAKLEFASLRVAKAYPIDSDEETRKFIRYWFDEYSRRQLTALSFAINRVRDAKVREVLWCGFSRLIITKQAGASLAMDLSHSRPHKAFLRAPIKPFDRFIAAVQIVVSNCPQKRIGPVGTPTVVKCGDARKLSLRKNSIDLVLTSPPYLNAIDYMRCSKFSLVWMGYNVSALRKIRSESVGAEVSRDEAVDSDWVKELIADLHLRPQLSKRDNALLSQYAWDMSRSLSEVSRVLRPGGRAVYVVGDSNIRGTFVRNSEIVAAVAKNHGLSIQSRQSRSLPANRRYLPPPNGSGAKDILNGRMRREVVMVFDKPQVGT